MIEGVVEHAGLPSITVGSHATAGMFVVMLHGFMMRPTDLSPFAASMGMPIYWLFPEGHVAAQPAGRAWWDIDPDLRAAALAAGPRDFADQHPPDLPRARAILSGFLDEVAKVAGDRPLVVGGFSQGGMLVLDLLLREPRPIAGLALLSSSRIACDEWPSPRDRLRGVPTLISHGRADPDLAFTAGEGLRDAVVAAGADVTWTPFDGGHEIPLLVWRRLRQLLSARL